MSDDAFGRTSDTTALAGSSRCSPSSATVSDTSSPVVGQREETYALLPSKAGNINASKAPRVETLAVNLKGMRVSRSVRA